MSQIIWQSEDNWNIFQIIVTYVECYGSIVTWQNSYVKTLTHKGLVLRHGALVGGDQLMRVETSGIGLVPLWKKYQKERFHSSANEDTAKRELSKKFTRSDSILIFDFPVSRTKRNKCLLCISHCFKVVLLW